MRVAAPSLPRSVARWQCLRPRLLLVILLAALPGRLHGQTPAQAPLPVAADPARPASADGAAAPAGLFGDAGGLRPALVQAGLALGASTTLEMARNPAGGRSQGNALQSLTTLTLDVDGDKAAGLDGITLHSSAFLITGYGLSALHAGAVNTISSIEATKATRLFELYLDTSLLGGALDLRLGQISPDQEFLTTDAGSVLVNASFGWPSLAAADLPAGGVAYPLATPGLRLALSATPDLTFRVALTNGNPAPEGIGDPQILNPSGTSFRLDGGVFAIAEIAADGPACLAATGWAAHCKIGAWYENHPAYDLRYDDQGLSLADPAGSGVARRYWSNFSLYASVERDIAALAPGRPVSLLLRAMGAPGDRNFISAFADAALVLHGPFAARANDRAALGAGWAQVSPGARGIANDISALDGLPQIARRNESFVEVTYQAALTPWMSVQPDIQYIMAPGGGIVRDDAAGETARNALVVLLRAAVTF